MTRRRSQVRRCNGAAMVEVLALLPFLLVTFLGAIQGFAYFSTTEQVDHAARAGARVASRGGDGAAAARKALSSPVRNNDPTIEIVTYGTTVRAHVTAEVPSLLGSVAHWTTSRSVEVPVG